MTQETILIALGGNAIDPSAGNHTIDEQWENIDRTARQIARVAVTGMRIVLTHGNGPQVGELLIQQEAAIRFVRWKGREAVIGSLDRVLESLEGTSGTRLVPE
jgi:carbamate kinase